MRYLGNSFRGTKKPFTGCWFSTACLGTAGRRRLEQQLVFAETKGDGVAKTVPTQSVRLMGWFLSVIVGAVLLLVLPMAHTHVSDFPSRRASTTPNA